MSVVTGPRYMGVSSHVIYGNWVKNIIRIGMFVTRGLYLETWVEEHHSLYDYTRVFVILGF